MLVNNKLLKSGVRDFMVMEYKDGNKGNVKNEGKIEKRRITMTRRRNQATSLYLLSLCLKCPSRRSV